MEEEWRDVVGYEGLYQVSNLGRVRRMSASFTDTKGRLRHFVGRVLRPQKLRHGYVYVNLWKDNVRKGCTIHRLVAIAFIPNPDNKPQVNHIDGDRANNKVENLEWTTNSENQRHRLDILHHKGVRIYETRKVVCVETGDVYDSITSASKFANVAVSNIVAVCRGYEGAHTSGGYHWKYID